jgi:hypothetical protein
MSLATDVDLGGLCFGVAAGVEEIYWANKSRDEHPNEK